MVYFYPKNELSEEYQRAGIRLFFLDIPETYHFSLAVSRLVKLIRQEKPDLLVSCLWRADMITRIASFISGVPVVGTLVNDSYSPLAWRDKKGLKFKLVYWLDQLTSRIPIHWIANAKALVDSHQRTLGLNPRKISVVYRGREIPKIPPKASQSIRNFVSYGRFLERKGFQDAIQAFFEVLKTYPDCTFTIFGEGPYRKELEELIQDLGLQDFVFLPGKIANPMNLLIHGYCPLPTAPDSYRDCPLITADCFLFPSWYEGFSGALVEAMMAGIPIIASDIPMNLEALEDQKTGLIFQTSNSSDLAQKMIWAIQNPSLFIQMGVEARKTAIQRFDIEKISKEYENVLLEIAEKTTKRW